MKKTKFIVMWLVAALIAFSINCVLAQSVAVIGVESGDNFTYSFGVVWSSANPTDIVPQYLSDLNQTVSIHFNVTDVGGATAYLDVTTTNRDGSQIATPAYISVTSGRGLKEAQLFIIGANLTIGDKAYPESTATEVEAGVAAESFTIDETVARTYLSTSKTANRYYERITNSTTGDYVDRDAYYDKETGILLEMTITHYYATTEETDTEHWKITQFNSAVTPSDGTDGTTSDNALPVWLVPAVVAVVVLVVIALVAVLMLRRRGKPQMRTSAPQEAPPSSV